MIDNFIREDENIDRPIAQLEVLAFIVNQKFSVRSKNKAESNANAE